MSVLIRKQVSAGIKNLLIFILFFIFSSEVNAVQFNQSFLKIDETVDIDLKYFESGDGVMPGMYSVDIKVNDALWKRQNVLFLMDERGQVIPELSIGMLREMGVDVERLKKDGVLQEGAAAETVVDLKDIPGASSDFNVNNLELQVSIPQVYTLRQSRGYVDPSLWDEGIAAFYSNYHSNFTRNKYNGRHSDYGYVGLRNGLNIGAWRVRNDASITSGTDRSTRVKSNRTYVERDLTGLRSRLALGELYTAGDIFDSVRFRGVQVGSDVGMLPDDEVGYAPVVRGIAESNATVEIRQNGYMIHSTSVSPGAFEISDIYPSGSNGDLEVTIIEADGRKRSFSQPYSFLPVMVRKGGLRYSVTAGEYRDSQRASPAFTQSTLIYGLSNNVTGFGGLLSGEDYQALNLGLGLNTSLGGMSLDVTNSRSKTRSGKKTGQSARLLYSKTFSQTNTTFTMVGYRYSTEGYRTFSQHVDDLDFVRSTSRGLLKSRLDLNINQNFGTGSSVFLSAGESSYWSTGGRTRRYQAGYSGNLRNASVSVSVSRTESASYSSSRDNQVSASISLPLGSRARSARVYASAVSSQRGDSSIQSGVSGYLDEESTIGYSAQANYSKEEHASGSLGLNWDTRYANLSTNYSQSSDDKHYDIGAAGAVVIHRGGVTFGSSVGETFALVEVPGVKGVGLDSSPSARTDSSGYVIANYVQPYRRNWINLDVSTAGSELELEDTSLQVVPRRGAIVRARFNAETGRRVQFELSLEGGGKIPFGAVATDQEGKVVGVVDNLSRLLSFGVKEVGILTIEWKAAACSADYKLPEKSTKSFYDRVAVICRYIISE